MQPPKERTIMIHTSQNAGFMIVQFPETLCCIAISAIPNMSLPCKVFCGMDRSHSSWYHSEHPLHCIILSANSCLCNSNTLYRPFSSLGYFRKSCESTWRTCINLYCVTLTYVRLRSGHMTHEKGLYVMKTLLALLHKS